MFIISLAKRSSGRYFLIALFTAIYIFSYVFSSVIYISFAESRGRYLNQKYGAFDYCVFDHTASYVSSGADEKTGSAVITGVCSSPEGELTMGALDANALGLLPISVLEGRLPEAVGEIALEEMAAFSLGADHPGSDIELTVTYCNGDTAVMAFKVVGLIADYSDKTPQNRENPFYRFPSVIVSVDGDGSGVIRYLLISLGSDSKSGVPEIQGKAVINEAKYSNENRIFIIVCFVVCLLLAVIGTTVMIAFGVLEKDKLKQCLFLCKTAGATASDYIRLRLSEKLLTGIPALVVGSSLGVTGAFLLITFISRKYTDWLTCRISVVNCVIIPIGAFLALIMVTFAVDAAMCRTVPLRLVLKEGKRRSDSVVGSKWFVRKPLFVRCVRNLISDSSAYVSMIMVFAGIFVAVLLMQIVFACVRQTYSDGLGCDYEMSMYGGQWVSAFSVPIDFDSFSQYEKKCLDDCPEVKECAAISRNTMFIPLYVPGSEAAKSASVSLRGRYSYSEDAMEMIDSECELYGYDKGMDFIPVTVWGVSDEVLNTLICDDNFDRERNAVLIYSGKDDPGTYKIGESIMLTAPREVAPGIIQRVDVELMVSHIVSIDSNSYMSGLFDSKEYGLVISQKVPDQKLGNGYNYFFIQLKNAGCYTETEKLLYQIRALNSGNWAFSFRSRREENAGRLNTESVLTVFIIAASVIMAVSTVVSVVQTVKNDLYGKKRLWGYLRAVSLSEDQACKCELMTVYFSALAGLLICAALFLIVCVSLGPQGAAQMIGFLSPAPLEILLTVMAAVIFCGIKVILKKFWACSVSELLHID